MDTFVVHVSYKLNRFDMVISPKGIKAVELLQLVCKRLELNTHRHYLAKHKARVSDNDLIPVWSRVDLCSFDDALPVDETPSMQQVLWDTASRHWVQSRQDLFATAAQDLFVDICAHLVHVCRYRRFDALVQMPFVDQPHSDDCYIPTVWTHYVLPFISQKAEQKSVQSVLRLCFEEQKLFPQVNDVNNVWSFNWKGEKMTYVISKITARDLIMMGYNVGNQALFGQILVELRKAIVCNNVSSESEEAQRDWVRRHFKL